MIINQFGRRNLVHYARAELALKLEELFHKKAKENQSNNFESFESLVEKQTPICQNSDKLVSINSPVSAVPETVDYDEETALTRFENDYANSIKSGCQNSDKVNLEC